MKITLDQDTLATAVISHLRSVGVQSDILGVDFRYTRVPYTVFAEVELVEAKPRPTKAALPVNPAKEPESVSEKPLVDPDDLIPEEPVVDEPPPEAPAAPLFSGGE